MDEMHDFQEECSSYSTVRISECLKFLARNLAKPGLCLWVHTRFRLANRLCTNRPLETLMALLIAHIRCTVGRRMQLGLFKGLTEELHR
jgi:hypothetical protein